MGKGNIKHIGICADKFLSKNYLNSDGYALRVFFAEIIGHKLAKYAELVKFSGDTITISAKAPVVKTEIMHLKRKLIKSLNEFLEKEKIKNIKIV